jgi:23S rRNA (guanine2535-N1)-methyltransferase
LAYLHRKHIREIIASDIDEKAVALANRNLGLLSVTGLDQRIGEITKMMEQYHKDSHREALASAHILKSKIIGWDRERPLATRVFQSSATDSETMLNKIKAKSVDIVFTDIPYGYHSQWHVTTLNESVNPLESMLEALIGILSSSSIVAVVSDKRQKVSHKSYQRIQQFQIGKRRVVILKPI